MADAMRLARWVVACVGAIGASAHAATTPEGDLALIDMCGIVLSETSLGLSEALRFDASVEPDALVTISIVYDTTTEASSAGESHAIYPAVVSFEILFGGYRIAGTEGTLRLYDNAPLGESGESVDFIAFDLVAEAFEGFLLNEADELVPLDEAQGLSIRTPTFATASTEVLSGVALVVPQPDEPWNVIGGGADLMQTVAPFELSHSISFGISRWVVPEPGVALLLAAVIAWPGRRALR
jgi:hypothetical protein